MLVAVEERKWCIHKWCIHNGTHVIDTHVHTHMSV